MSEAKSVNWRYFLHQLLDLHTGAGVSHRHVSLQERDVSSLLEKTGADLS